MVTVQLRDAANPDKVLAGPLALPFEPQPNKPLYLRPRFNDSDRKARCFIITEVHRYEIVENEPERSGIVYLARQVPV
jgi:hypothetical protein